MFGSLTRLLATSLQLVVGLAGLLVFVAALLVATAVPAASAVGSGSCAEIPRVAGFGFSPCARLDFSSIDDLRPSGMGDDARLGA